MTPYDRHDRLYVGLAFTVQGVLLAYFATRTLAFDTAMSIGWVVYALAVPAALAGVVLMRASKPPYLWLGGLLYAAWAAFGFAVDVAARVSWRHPIVVPVFVPYVALYLAATMFLWWPLGRYSRRLWLACGVLFAAGTVLNVMSHGWG